MATLQELKERIDLYDLAEKLGLERPGKQGNYRCPKGGDKLPSLSIFREGKAWKCHRCQEGGTCIDLVLHAEGGDISSAARRLHEIYSIPPDTPRGSEPPREKTRVEYIADRCLQAPDQVLDYLESRKISREVIRAAIKHGTLGYNDWRSAKVPEGEPTHGGPAAAFIVRTPNPGHVVAVDMRFIDPALNGGVKTQSHGEKDGVWWTSDWKRALKAKTVYIVESAINALSIETAEGRPAFAVVALRGTGNAANVDLRWLRGKRVIIVCDNDEPFPADHPQAGYRPGLRAAWVLHERLTALDIAAQLVDQDQWDHNDVNDILQAEGPDGLRQVLARIEPWIIPGQSGKLEAQFGRKRVYLPFHDSLHYIRYRVKEDFTEYVTKSGADEHGHEQLSTKELAGFRVAAISRVTIASAVSTMTGDPDPSPRVQFAVSVQTPRHGAQLLRRVVDDEKLHNIDSWKRLGPVWDQGQFLRMVNILERAAHIGERHATNFVGLAYRDGRPIVNEGADCYFTFPDRQCPYHALTFPSGARQDARAVVEAYQKTFKGNAAAMTLVWALGGHLKAFLGFWPHMMMQASKGSGKSTLVKRLERTIAMIMMSGQSMQSEFRLLTSTSHTSHPVGWEEISARKQELIDKAVSLLQEAYQYTLTRRGSEMTEYLICAPVLLAGEDVPVRSLTGKLVRCDLSGKKGDMLPEDLPVFPIRQWLEFLATFDRKTIREIHNAQLARCLEASRATGSDDGAVRMAGNYAGVLTAWRLLAEFCDIDPGQGAFERDLIAEMNSHVRETSSDRQVWVWIIETLLSELAASNFRFPYAWDMVDDEMCLIVRTSHVMDHLAHSHNLREWYNGLPIKSDRVLKRELRSAGVIVSEEVERTFGPSDVGGARKRVAHMTALSLARLETYGLYATPVY